MERTLANACVQAMLKRKGGGEVPIPNFSLPLPWKRIYGKTLTAPSGPEVTKLEKCFFMEKSFWETTLQLVFSFTHVPAIEAQGSRKTFLN